MKTLHPGLYSQEIKRNDRPITGVSTSLASFVGTAPRGAINKPVFVGSWAQYCDEFGGLSLDSSMAYQVKSFFENGGSMCYVVRVVHVKGGNPSATKSTIDIKNSGSSSKVVASIFAKSEGKWGDDLSISIEAHTDSKTFDLTIYYKTDIVKVYEKLTLADAEALINQDSKFITITSKEDEELPATLVKTALKGGGDGLEELADSDYLGDSATKTGLHALDDIKINMVAIPGITTQESNKGLLDYASNREDCVAYLDAPKGMSPQECQDYVVKKATLSSDYGAIYYPWVKVLDPLGVGKQPIKLISPCGIAMGITARTDSAVGCWQSPAGLDYGRIKGIVGLEREISDDDQDLLNPCGINCLRNFEGSGAVIWGARTLGEGDFKYLSVRRLVLFARQSIIKGLGWTVFRPNDPDLWNASSKSIENFLTGLWTSHGLRGSSPSEAYFIVCDNTNNTPDTIDEGQMYIDLGLSAHKPAEFVILRIGIKR